MNNLSWIKGDKPENQGSYIIAIEYNNGMGACVTGYWSPAEGWFDLAENQRVIAYISVADIVAALPTPWED